MNETFVRHFEALHPSFEQLVAVTPFTFSQLREQVLPTRGVYLFSEGTRHMYVGRSNDISARTPLPAVLHGKPSLVCISTGTGGLRRTQVRNALDPALRRIPQSAGFMLRASSARVAAGPQAGWGARRRRMGNKNDSP